MKVIWRFENGVFQGEGFTIKRDGNSYLMEGPGFPASCFGEVEFAMNAAERLINRMQPKVDRFTKVGDELWP